MISETDMEYRIAQARKNWLLKLTRQSRFCRLEYPVNPKLAQFCAAYLCFQFYALTRWTGSPEVGMSCSTLCTSQLLLFPAACFLPWIAAFGFYDGLRDYCREIHADYPHWSSYDCSYKFFPRSKPLAFAGIAAYALLSAFLSYFIIRILQTMLVGSRLVVVLMPAVSFLWNLLVYGMLRNAIVIGFDLRRMEEFDCRFNEDNLRNEVLADMNFVTVFRGEKSGSRTQAETGRKASQRKTEKKSGTAGTASKVKAAFNDAALHFTPGMSKEEFCSRKGAAGELAAKTVIERWLADHPNYYLVPALSWSRLQDGKKCILYYSPEWDEWAEIDLLLCGPTGLTEIEVKNHNRRYSVSRLDGGVTKWMAMDNRGVWSESDNPDSQLYRHGTVLLSVMPGISLTQRLCMADPRCTVIHPELAAHRIVSLDNLADELDAIAAEEPALYSPAVVKCLVDGLCSAQQAQRQTVKKQRA